MIHLAIVIAAVVACVAWSSVAFKVPPVPAAPACHAVHCLI